MPTDALPMRSDTPWQRRLHHGHQHHRQSLIQSLLAHADATEPTMTGWDCHPARKLANKLVHCGRHPQVLWSGSEERIVIASSRCKARICPSCGAARSRSLRASLLPIVREMDSPRLITLTLASSDAPIREQIARLQRCWRRLRGRKAARAYLAGGLTVVEITYNAERDQWHPHLHILAEGSYWPQTSLANLWEAITGDSRIVDIRAIHDRKDAVAYVTSYVSKAQQPRHAPPHRLWEWCEAVHGLRMAQTWGCYHPRPLRVMPHDTARDLRPLAPLNMLMAAAEQGDETAAAILADLWPTAAVKPAPPDSDADGGWRAHHVALADRIADWWAAEHRRRSPSPLPPDRGPPTPDPQTLIVW